MDHLDVPTLLQASAIVNLMAALVWLLLAEAFRIAPRASRLMAAAHVARILSQGCVGLTAHWPELLRHAVQEFATLGCVLLLLLALRRMLRNRQGLHDIVWIAVPGALGVAAGLALGRPLASELAGTATIAALALLSVREVLSGLGSQRSQAVAWLTTLPFALLALMSLAHAAELLLVPGWAGRLARDELPSPQRVLLWFLVTAAVTLTLMRLMIWRVITRIQDLTCRDPLTGALNRRAFEQALDEAQAQLQRGRRFALAMIDIDHFKRVNDQHGHAAGDAALRHCVAIWQAGLREVDRLGRLGGEEFCVLLPLGADSDLATAARVVERLRSSLAAQPLPWNGQLLPLTASFGVALPVADDAQGQIGLARADAELYRAKAEGRNRVCVALHLQPASP